MWPERRSATAPAIVAGLVLAVGLLVGCSGGGSGDGAGGSESTGPPEVAAVGDEVDAGGASARVVAVEADVQATAAVYAAEGERVAVEVEVCGDAEAVADLWTLEVGDDVLQPVPLPDGAMPEANRPVFDFTAGPEADGCRR
ncbi:hypothetical protein B7486_62125, partial [cyanobacterium TDX16]